MDCGEFVEKDVFSVEQSETVQRAAEIMAEAHVGFLPVCGAARDVVGAITDRDIAIRVVAKGMPAQTTVADVMTRGVATCGIREKVLNAIDTMRDAKVSRLVCLDEQGALAGVLSVDKIVRHQKYQREGAILQETLAEARVH